MNIAALKRAKADAVAKMQAIVTLAETENRDLNPDEQAAYDAHKAEIASLDARIARAEELNAASIASAQPLTPVGAQVHDNAGDAPWSPDGDPRRGFGNFLSAIVRADQRVSGVVDPRLHKHALPTGSGETVGADGGFLVSTDETTELNKIMFASAQLASRCQRVEISPNANGLKTKMLAESSRAAGSRWGGVQVYWEEEADDATATKPKFRVVDQSLRKMMGIWYVTSELLQDASYIASVGANAFGEEMAFALDEAIYRGDGAGKPIGILNSASLVSQAKETGQAAATIVYENLAKMFSRLPAGSIGRAAWFVNPNTLPQLMTMHMVIGTSGYPVYLPANGAADAPFGTLLGRPVIPNEHSNTLGTVGDIVLADLGWYRLIAKGGITAASSIHVKFVYDEVAFRFTYRVNGMPMLDAAITPAQSSGSDTVSPFVALATRA